MKSLISCVCVIGNSMTVEICNRFYCCLLPHMQCVLYIVHNIKSVTVHVERERRTVLVIKASKMISNEKLHCEHNCTSCT